VATDLFAAVHGLDPADLNSVVPPACRRPIGPVAQRREDGGAVVFEFPEWRPRAPARHLLPSLSALVDGPLTVRFETSVLAGGAWTPWIGAATLGPRSLPGIPASGAMVEADIDVFHARQAAEAVRLRLRTLAADATVLEEARWLVTLSVSDAAASPPAAADGSVRLPVPALSQMDAPASLRLRICSPTSVAMVLSYLGTDVDREAVAADVFHAGTDRYGVWPAAIAAAGRWGRLGYLLRFPDWPSAAWCLEHRLPIIASIRYAAGELAGAAMPETTGHLVVVTGYDDGDVLVNDPAAPDVRSVPRRYRRAEFTRAWLAGTAVGYVLFRPS
jgi:hypothetical protein